MNTGILALSDDRSLTRAQGVLRRGGLVAMPTETVYGIGGLAFEEAPILRLYEVKGRSKELAIPVLISSRADLDRVARDVPAYVDHLMDTFWPGPLTIILSGTDRLPSAISRSGTVGLRMPDHPFVLSLIQAVGPLGMTSANRSGGENSHTAEEVLAQLDGRFELLIDGGKTPGGVPSTVIDCTAGHPYLLREGPISFEQIRRIAQKWAEPS